MNAWETLIKEIVDRMGFREYRLEVLPEENRASLFIYEDEGFFKENLPVIVDALNHLLQMIARKNQSKAIFLDINHYRQERENLITELAKAAAKKALATKEEVFLPAMNSYERRLVHVALVAHPDVTTESIGTGKGRYVVIKPIDFGKKKEQNEAEVGD
jgi:predicted RNA-binding protein Jag